MIIQSILEVALRAVDPDFPREGAGVVKSRFARDCGLKTATAEKYLNMMVQANYLNTREEAWGDRTITRYYATLTGRERYAWFVRINTELGFGGE